MKPLIECFAAAFCGNGTKTPVAAPRTAETETVIAVIRALRGNARFLKDGMLHVYPVKYRPAPEGVRLPTATGEQFLFLTGIAATQGLAFSADALTDPPAPAACAAVQKAAGFPECLCPTPTGGLSCGFAPPLQTTVVSPRLPAAFAAGALTGAALAPRDADLVFACCEPDETLLFARETLVSFGVTVEELVDGWRVRTRIGALPALPEKLRRKHNYWIAGRRK